MRLALAVGFVAAWAACGAGANARQGKCVPMAGDVTLIEGVDDTRESDTVHYNQLKGKLQRGGGPLPVCPNVKYRFVPEPRCLVRLPAKASSLDAARKLIEQRARSVNCPSPSILVVSQAAPPLAHDDTVRIIPSGEINIRVRREVVLIDPSGNRGDNLSPCPQSPSIGPCPFTSASAIRISIPNLNSDGPPHDPPPPPEDPPLPSAVAGAVGGAGGLLAFQQLFLRRRRESAEERQEGPSKAGREKLPSSHRWQARARPDLPQVQNQGLS